MLGIIVCLLILGYAYLAYPVVLWAVSRLWRAELRREPGLRPSVTVVIAAHNEELHIEQRLRNLAELSYPAGRLEVLVGSDGSNDRTVELARRVGLGNVRILEFPERRGKIAVLNELASLVRTELMAFSDANTLWAADALEWLTPAFADPSVGGVSGRLRLRAGSEATGVEGRYWDLESAVKGWESDLGTTIGANGAIYAIRAALWRPLPEDRPLMDDFVIGCRVVEGGARLLFEPRALAWESTSVELGQEVRRKRRIFVANFCGVPLLLGLLRPSLPAVFYVSRKLLRWLTPWVLLLLAASAWSARETAPGRALLGLGLGWLAAAFLYGAGLRARVLTPFYYMLLLQWELARGLVVAFWGRPAPAWERSAR